MSNIVLFPHNDNYEPTDEELAEIEADDTYLFDTDLLPEYGDLDSYEPETDGVDDFNAYDPYDKEYDVP